MLKKQQSVPSLIFEEKCLIDNLGKGRQEGPLWRSGKRASDRRSIPRFLGFSNDGLTSVIVTSKDGIMSIGSSPPSLSALKF